MSYEVSTETIQMLDEVIAFSIPLMEDFYHCTTSHDNLQHISLAMDTPRYDHTVWTSIAYRIYSPRPYMRASTRISFALVLIWARDTLWQDAGIIDWILLFIGQ